MVSRAQAGGVSETLESARRWSGYVCPDCRFVFRVPRDHDGKGIVCPGCRRMLRIPTTADAPPPLMMSLRRMAVEENVTDAEPKVLKKRRRGKKHGSSENHSWEQNSKSPRSGRSEKGQMRLMLIGGAALFALIVAGVIFSMNSGEKPVVAPLKEAASPVTAAKSTGITVTPPVAERGEASILAEAEPLARKFLEAKTVEELLPLVRHPEVTEARMRGFYPEGKIEAPGISQFNSGGGLSIRGKLVSLSVTTRDLLEKQLAFVETAQGLKIDWESWTDWVEIPWEKFLSTKPATGGIFRVTLSEVDYYNFGFADESKWQSYRLLSLDGEHSLYGYVGKGSVLDQRIRPAGDTKSVALMLALKFPTGAPSGSQVEIERFVTEGWVEEDSQ